MNAVYGTSAAGLYSAKSSLRPANFYCAAPDAKSVELAGDFNHWHRLPMHQRVDGWWFIQVRSGRVEANFEQK
jgi:1,4-alpha-glucan branching enzyme